MHTKDFNKWNIQKQHINSSLKSIFFNEREIWWCALGVNVGAEIDGKNGKFERPALIVKYINHETVVILPLTTKGKSDAFHFQLKTSKTNSFAKISQLKVISCKRLLRKVDMLPVDQFGLIKQRLIDFLS